MKLHRKLPNAVTTKLDKLRKLLVIPFALALIVAASSISGAYAQTDYCAPGEQPEYVLGFGFLADLVGNDVVGDPVECEHYEGTQAFQRTSEGEFFYDQATNTPVFTRGVRHWAWTDNGLVTWTGPTQLPPADAAMVRTSEFVTNATLGAVNDAPLAYSDQTVTVEGDVNVLLGPSAFTIASNTITDDDETLVVSAFGEALNNRLVEDESIQVTGEPVLFAIADIEQDFDLDLDDDLYVEWEGQPAILATSITSIEGFENDVESDMVIDPVADFFTLDMVLDNPEAYYGETIAGTTEVGSLIDANSMTIETEELLFEEELLVFDPTGTIPTFNLTEEADVNVQGTLREFVLADIEQDFDLDLDDDLYVDWETEPVLIADSISVANAADVDADVDTDIDTDVDTAMDDELPDSQNVTLGEVNDDPLAYAGQTVAVEGDVNVVLDETAFTIASNTLTDDDETLVINASEEALDLALVVDEGVIVTGEPVQFILADVEEEWGLDLDDDLLIEYETRPAIIAESISVMTE